MTDAMIDIVLTVPKTEATRVLGMLAEDESLDAESMPSAGAEGGGGFSAIVMMASRRSIEFIGKTVKTLAAGQDIKLQIGQTKFEGKHLRDPDISNLIKRVLEAELKRAANAASRK